MVAIFFGIITRRAIRHGTFHRVRDHETAIGIGIGIGIGIYIDGWNNRVHVFTGTKNADDITAQAPNQKIDDTSRTR